MLLCSGAMSKSPDVQRCLAALVELSAECVALLDDLPLAAWDGQTNCPPWRVRELAAHMVSSGEGFVTSIRNGLAGSVAPPAAAERDRRRIDLESADSRFVARALEAVTSAFVRLYHGLSDDELESICFHRRGNRSVRWYAAHRLAEVAFHQWDLQTSLGRQPVFRDDVAALLLPTLLESNAPRTYAAGLSQQRGSGERYLLSVADEPGARWLVEINRDELVTHRDDGPADTSISGSAGALALLVYGRADIHTAPISIGGDVTLADRFALIFPRP